MQSLFIFTDCGCILWSLLSARRAEVFVNIPPPNQNIINWDSLRGKIGGQCIGLIDSALASKHWPKSWFLYLHQHWDLSFTLGFWDRPVFGVSAFPLGLPHQPLHNLFSVLWPHRPFAQVCLSSTREWTEWDSVLRSLLLIRNQWGPWACMPIRLLPVN